MSNAVLEPIAKLFRSPRPLLACEFTPGHIIVAVVDSSRRRVLAKVASPLPEGALAGSLLEKNLLKPETVHDVLQDALKQAGARGFEISVVIPDESSRIAFLSSENPPAKAQEREAFIRWKLKKSVPFDVDAAQMAYQILGHAEKGEKSVDIVVALSPRAIVQEYEALLEKVGYHAGYVGPSTLGALNLLPPAAAGEDTLFVKLCPEGVTTTVYQNGRPRFFRRVGNLPIYDAVYPTMMYYQDKLGGVQFAGAVVCGYNGDPRDEIYELQDKIGVPVRRMGPIGVDDIFKPVLGALDWVWAESN